MCNILERILNQPKVFSMAKLFTHLGPLSFNFSMGVVFLWVQLKLLDVIYLGATSHSFRCPCIQTSSVYIYYTLVKKLSLSLPNSA